MRSASRSQWPPARRISSTVGRQGFQARPPPQIQFSDCLPWANCFGSIRSPSFKNSAAMRTQRGFPGCFVRSREQSAAVAAVVGVMGGEARAHGGPSKAAKSQRSGDVPSSSTATQSAMSAPPLPTTSVRRNRRTNAWMLRRRRGAIGRRGEVSRSRRRGGADWWAQRGGVALMEDVAELAGDGVVGVLLLLVRRQRIGVHWWPLNCRAHTPPWHAPPAAAQWGQVGRPVAAPCSAASFFSLCCRPPHPADSATEYAPD